LVLDGRLLVELLELSGEVVGVDAARPAAKTLPPAAISTTSGGSSAA
jgi:hypothetical protein